MVGSYMALYIGSIYMFTYICFASPAKTLETE